MSSRAKPPCRDDRHLGPTGSRLHRALSVWVLYGALNACGGQAAEPASAAASESAGAAPATATMTDSSSAQPHAATDPPASTGQPSAATPQTMPAMPADATAGTGSRVPQAGTGLSSADSGASQLGPAAGSGGTPATTAGMGASAGAAGSPPMTAEAEQPCTSASTLASGDNRKTLSQDGRDRRYNVYVPSTLPAMQRVPLVLDFHGNGSSGAQEESGSGWRQKADAEGFIVVYPDGVGNGWNVGNCCGEALANMIDDVGFARAMVESVSSEACIDAHRVYATGISNGAGLAHRLACEAADVFAAIAAASADLVTDPCTPARPISELSVRGLSDTLVNYDGGNTGSTGWYSPGAKGTLNLWKDIDGCTGSVSMPQQYCESYTQCSAGVEVTLCSLPGTGHILYTNSLGFSVPDTAWEMFQRQTLP